MGWLGIKQEKRKKRREEATWQLREERRSCEVGPREGAFCFSFYFKKRGGSLQGNGGGKISLLVSV